MKFFKRLKTDRKFLLIVIGLVIATFTVPYLTIPGLMLWWFYKTPRISKKIKIILTGWFGAAAVLLVTFVVLVYAKDLDPHLTVVEPSANTKIQAKQITLKGKFDPPDRTIWINDKRVPSVNGNFETVYDLREGENKIDIVAGKWKRVHVYLTVTRELTAEEIAARATPAPTPTATPKPSSVPTQEPSKAPVVQKQATPAPTSIPTPKTTPIPIPTQPALKQPSIMDQLWTVLDRTMGTRKEYDIVYNQTTKYVTVIHEAKDFWDETSLVKGGYSTLVKYGMEAFKISGVDEVEIVIKTGFTDQYGKSQIEKAMYISMKKDEFNKYDWKNLNYQLIYNQMENSADEYWIHPAILKKLNFDKLWLSI